MQFIPFMLGALKAVGTVVEGIGQSRNLKAVQESNRISAVYERENAANELRIATADAEKQRREGRRKVAEQIAGFSQSGFGLSGSPELSVQESAANAELDALGIQYKGVLRNREHLIAAQNYDTAAENARRARKGMPFKILLGAATNLLSGYASSQRRIS